jgi:Fur family peroxide stress response transcriptional regulator
MIINLERLLDCTPSEENSPHRKTMSREAIYQFIQECTTHPTAGEIFQALKPKFPSLSLATVYNTLQFLASECKISVLGDLGDGRIHFDRSVEPHLNLVCDCCKKVIDMPDKFYSQTIEQLQNESGFKINSSRILFFGLCPDCQKKNKINQIIGENNGK